MTTPAGGPQGSKDMINRLKEIEEVEKTIRDLLQLSQSCVSELSKEKQPAKVMPIYSFCNSLFAE